MPKKKEEAETKPKIRIKLRSYDHKVLDGAAKQIVEVLLRHGVQILGPIPLPTETHRFTLLRPTFIHKDSREQYEQRIHKRLIEIPAVTPAILEALKNINLPAGVEIQIKT